MAEGLCLDPWSMTLGWYLAEVRISAVARLPISAVQLNSIREHKLSIDQQTMRHASVCDYYSTTVEYT